MVFCEGLGEGERILDAGNFQGPVKCIPLKFTSSKFLKTLELERKM